MSDKFQNPYLPGTRDEFIVNNMKLAQKIAWKYARKHQGNVDFNEDDFLSISYIGLIKAYEKFDPTKVETDDGRQVKFSTYAVPMIEGEIRRTLRDNNDGGLKVSRVHKDILTRMYMQDIPLNEDPQVIADKLQFPLEQVILALKSLGTKNCARLDETLYSSNNADDNAITFGQSLGIIDDGVEENIIITDFVDRLPRILQKVYEFRIKAGLPQLQVAKLVNRSQVQVSRYEKALLKAAEQYGRGEELRFKRQLFNTNEGVKKMPPASKYPEELKDRVKNLALSKDHIAAEEIYNMILREFPDYPGIPRTTVVTWISKIRVADPTYVPVRARPHRREKSGACIKRTMTEEEKIKYGITEVTREDTGATVVQVVGTPIQEPSPDIGTTPVEEIKEIGSTGEGFKVTPVVPWSYKPEGVIKNTYQIGRQSIPVEDLVKEVHHLMKYLIDVGIKTVDASILIECTNNNVDTI